jgi:hypothetical protein
MAKRAVRAATRAQLTGPTPDFLAQVDVLRRRVVLLLVEPSREALRRAIHDGWRVILQPRAADLRGPLDDLVKARWWDFGADDTADLLTEAGWTHHARPLAGLYAALGGALTQYLRIRVRWEQPTRFGILEGSATPITKSADVAKEKEKQEKAAADLRKRLDALHEKALADVLAEWGERQRTLMGLMEAVRDLVVALQQAEEERLRAGVGADAPSSTAAALEAMKLARIDLAHFIGPSAAGFGSLLDRWRGARARIV